MQYYTYCINACSNSTSSNVRNTEEQVPLVQARFAFFHHLDLSLKHRWQHHSSGHLLRRSESLDDARCWMCSRKLNLEKREQPSTDLQDMNFAMISNDAYKHRRFKFKCFCFKHFKPFFVFVSQSRNEGT